jgi:hypothetical protein
MKKPIENGVRQGGFPEGVVPLLHRELADDDGGLSAVAIFEDFEEVASLLVSKRRNRPIVMSLTI